MPEFYMIFCPKMLEFFMTFDEKYFSPNLGGRGRCPLPPLLPFTTSTVIYE